MSGFSASDDPGHFGLRFGFGFHNRTAKVLRLFRYTQARFVVLMCQAKYDPATAGFGKNTLNLHSFALALGFYLRIHFVGNEIGYGFHAEQSDSTFLAANSKQNSPDFAVEQQIVERSSFQSVDPLYICAPAKFWD